jgi:hypothetical protein
VQIAFAGSLIAFGGGSVASVSGRVAGTGYICAQRGGPATLLARASAKIRRDGAIRAIGARVPLDVSRGLVHVSGGLIHLGGRLVTLGECLVNVRERLILLGERLLVGERSRESVALIRTSVCGARHGETQRSVSHDASLMSRR